MSKLIYAEYLERHLALNKHTGNVKKFIVVVAVIIITISFKQLSQILPKAMYFIFSNF